MSHQANFLGHYDHAVNLARSAAHGARDRATPTGMALFHAMEARAVTALVRADVAGGLSAASPLVASDAWPDLMIRWLTMPERGAFDPRALSSADPAEAMRVTTEAFSQLDYLRALAA